jgi:5'-nucleotidase
MTEEKADMRILITNDDGIHAPGLGVSHSLSLNDPMRLREIAPDRFAVKGTPTDCVIMGIKHIMREKRPDLVLSGVNRGQNVAEDVTYSGTIAGAMEGTLLGVPSIALSQAYKYGDRESFDWAATEAHGVDVVRKILAAGIPKGILMNANFPACTPAEVQGIAITVQGQRNQALLDVEKRLDGRGNPYYWLAFARGRITPAEGTDLHALAENRISITPLRLDLTDLPELTRLAGLIG